MSKLPCTLPQAFLAPNYSIPALLIQRTNFDVEIILLYLCLSFNCHCYYYKLGHDGIKSMLKTDNDQMLIFYVGYVDQLKLVKNVDTELNDSLRLLEKSYNLHKNLESKLASVQKRAEDSRLQSAESSPYKAVYQAVRSLRLHLHTTLQR